MKTLNQKIIETLLEKLANINIVGIPFCSLSPNKKTIFINENIDLKTLNQYLTSKNSQPVDSYEDFIFRFYNINGDSIIEEVAPYSEESISLPPLSLVPSTQNPKVIQVNF